jgi:dsDNA-binding SOS-regulon protein
MLKATPLKALAVVVVLSLTAACSSNFVYSRLDTLAGWYLGSLVSLDENQQQQLEQWLAQTLDWHRQSELKRYADFLRDLSQQVMQRGTPTSYDQTQQRFEGFWQELIAKTAPEAASLLQGLSPAQVDELISNMDEKARERAEDEESDPDEWRRDQVKGLTKFLKRWTGGVSDEQKTLIATTAGQLEPSQRDWLASQQAWQRALQNTLSAPASTERTARIEQLLAKANNEWTQEYVDKSQRNRQRYMDLISSLDATLSSQQREHLRAELLKVARQLDTIARGKS